MVPYRHLQFLDCHYLLSKYDPVNHIHSKKRNKHLPPEPLHPYSDVRFLNPAVCKFSVVSPLPLISHDSSLNQLINLNIYLNLFDLSTGEEITLYTFLKSFWHSWLSILTLGFMVVFYAGCLCHILHHVIVFAPVSWPGLQAMKIEITFSVELSGINE